MAKRIVLALGVVLLTGSAAFAQTPAWTEGRIFLGVNGGAQVGSTRDEATSFSFSLYGEPATVGVTRSVKGGPLFDIMAGGRVIGNLGVAGTLFMRKASSDGAVTASLPHPIFYDQPRSITSTVPNMTHEELWSAVQAVYLVRIDDRLDMLLLAGPTVVSVKHQVATAATVTEGASAPTVTMTTQDLTKMVWGYSLGADLRYMLTKNFGLGAFARYTGATANMNSVVSIKLGGFQVGGGIRVQIK